MCLSQQEACNAPARDSGSDRDRGSDSQGPPPHDAVTDAVLYRIWPIRIPGRPERVIN